MMNEGNAAMSQPWRDFYNSLAWVLLDLSEPQFLLAWRLWQLRRKRHSAPQTWARAFLKRMHRANVPDRPPAAARTL